MKKYLFSSLFFSAIIFLPDGVEAQAADTVNVSTDTLSVADKISSIADTLIQKEQNTPHKYRMNYWFSAGLSVVASAANVYAIPNVIKNKEPLTDQEIQSLNRNKVGSFDRWALNLDPSQREDYYKYSDYTLPVIIASAATLAIDKNIRKDWVRILMMYYEMHAITFSIYNFSFFGPAFQNKLRPIVYYDQYSLDDRRGGNNRNSLYSGHTATAAAATFFMVKVYSDYHPELGGKKYLLYALASLPPLAEGYLRIKALAHFPTDVMVGFMIGATIGVVVPELHKFHDRQLHIGLTATPVGPGLSINWQPDYSPKKILIF